MHRGQFVFDWFDGFGAADRPHIIFSVTKSMAALLAGVLVGRGVLDPENLVTDYLPELADSAYAGATIRHLLDMQIASGFREDYADSDGIFMAYRRAAAWNPVEEGSETEGLRHFLTQMPKSDAAPHGQSHHYCSPHSDVLGWVIERAGNDSFANQFSLHILQPCGCHHDGYITLDTFGAPRVSGGMCLGLYDLLLLVKWCAIGATPMGVKWCRLAGLTKFLRYVITIFGEAKISPKAPVFSLMAITDHYGIRLGLKIRKFAPLAFMVNGCGSTRKNSW